MRWSRVGASAASFILLSLGALAVIFRFPEPPSPFLEAFFLLLIGTMPILAFLAVPWLAAKIDPGAFDELTRETAVGVCGGLIAIHGFMTLSPGGFSSLLPDDVIASTGLAYLFLLSATVPGLAGTMLTASWIKARATGDGIDLGRLVVLVGIAAVVFPLLGSIEGVSSLPFVLTLAMLSLVFVVALGLLEITGKGARSPFVAFLVVTILVVAVAIGAGGSVITSTVAMIALGMVLLFALLAERVRSIQGDSRGPYWRAVASNVLWPLSGGLAFAGIVALVIAGDWWLTGGVEEPVTTGAFLLGSLAAGLIARGAAERVALGWTAMVSAWLGTVGVMIGLGAVEMTWWLPRPLITEGYASHGLVVAITYLPMAIIVSMASARLPFLVRVSWDPKAGRAMLAGALVLFASVASVFPPEPEPESRFGQEEPELLTYEVSWSTEGMYSWETYSDEGGQGTYTFEIEIDRDDLAVVNVSVAVQRAYEPRAQEEISWELEGPEGQTVSCSSEVVGDEPVYWSCMDEAEVQPRPSPSQHTAYSAHRAEAEALQNHSGIGAGTWVVTVTIEDAAGEVDPLGRSYEIHGDAMILLWTPEAQEQGEP